MKHAISAFFVVLFGVTMTFAQGSPAKSSGPYTVEYYYKVKWGHSEEFLTLFKKNHYPLLKKGVEIGPHAQGLYGAAATAHDRRCPLGLSRHHRV